MSAQAHQENIGHVTLCRHWSRPKSPQRPEDNAVVHWCSSNPKEEKARPKQHHRTFWVVRNRSWIL